MIKQKTEKYLRDRFTTLAQQAILLKSNIDHAKTQLKKDFYSKKLLKINKQVLDVLLLINSSQQPVQQGATPGKTEMLPLIQEDDDVI